MAVNKIVEKNRLVVVVTNEVTTRSRRACHHYGRRITVIFD